MESISISVTNDLATDQRVQRISATLCREGFLVRLIGRKLPGSPSLVSIPFSAHRFHMLINKGPFFYAFYNIRLFFYLIFMKRPSILIAVDLDTLLANYLVGRLRRIPLLYDCHEYFTEVPELQGRDFVRNVWERVERVVIPGLEYAMTVSDSIAVAYEKKYRTKFHVIRNYPVLKQPVIYPEFSDAYPSANKIIYQGALNMGRGIELMISAMQHMENTILFIVGDGDLRVPLQALAGGMDLDSKVLFLGRVPPEKLHKITCQCDVGLSLEEDMGLSYRLALPNKIFDYIQAGIPVFCSDLPEMSALVKKYRVGLVCTDRSPFAVAGQLRVLLSDTRKNGTLRQNLEKAAAALSWENEEGKFIELVSRMRRADIDP